MIEDIAITIFGRHTESWMAALGPGAPVWAQLKAVRTVRVLEPSSDGADLLPNLEAGRPVLIPLLEQHIRSRPPGYFALCPSSEALETLADKAMFAAYVKRHGLEALSPKVYDTVDEAVFPLLVKPTKLNAGSGIKLIHNRDQYEDFRASATFSSRPHILQAYLEDDQDYGTHLLCRDGRIVWHQSFRYVLPPNSPIRGPVTHLTSEVCSLEDEQIKALEQFVMPLKFSGPCNVDHKIAPDGSVCVLEINPRIGGSLILPANLASLTQVICYIIDNAELDPRERNSYSV
ncbi:hypothetical protein GU700_07235 [Methylobacterium sp. NI91]|nr:MULTISPECIES: hypothetical protein [unclassified Methylobacterium]QIJ74389.1 hypothetical protein CLZ_07235 [Methylobacterium sp. CLZ]QIJ79295.1 hypothetical protein GU700_07235 [Methylobacterium sp. NI91]